MLTFSGSRTIPGGSLRAVAVATAAALLLSLCALATQSAVPARAAWTNVMTMDGGKLQLCRVPLGGGKTRVKGRLDNRNAKHTHTAGFTRIRGENRTNRAFKVVAGKRSGIKAIKFRQGDKLSAGMGHPDGSGGGGQLPLRDLPRC